MLVYSFSTFCPLSSLLFSPACLIIFGFCPFCSFIQFSLKRHMELLHCEKDLLLHGKEYISSACLFHPARLLNFSKISTLLVYSIPAWLFHPACYFHPARLVYSISARLLIFRKISPLLVYSIPTWLFHPACYFHRLFLFCKEIFTPCSFSFCLFIFDLHLIANANKYNKKL